MSSLAASILVKGSFSETAVKESAAELLKKMDGKITCGFVFATNDYLENLEDFTELIRLHGHVPEIFGCTGAGLINTGMEEEGESGFSMIFLSLPETNVFSYEFTQRQIEEASTTSYWHYQSGIKPDDVDGWIVFSDPFRVSVEKWLQGWNQAYPGVPCVGGLASGLSQQDNVAVFHNSKIIKDGGLAVGFKGRIKFRSLVSQGCRPIGEPLTVTKVENNIVFSLGSQTAYQALDLAFAKLTDEEKRHARGNLFAGIASSEYIDNFKQGDFLIRNIVGADPQSGAVAVGEYIRVGQTMQYQLRDRESAENDMKAVLKKEKKKTPPPFAALLFSCNGRGKALFEVPNHDAGAFAEAFGPISTAGFFCNGEIGPIGSNSYIHGFTASAALFYDRK